MSMKYESKLFTEIVSSYLHYLNSAPIRGEYKVLIHKRYLVQSLHYKLAVNELATIIKKSNAIAEIHKELTRPDEINHCSCFALLSSPQHPLSTYSTSAYLSYLSAITTSPDPPIEEIASLVFSSFSVATLESP